MATPLSEMPTLSLLYKLNRISAPADNRISAPADNRISAQAGEEPKKPNASFNDKISVIRQDITTLEVDAIVNAANKLLGGGGGVDGAIHRAAGPELYDECKTLHGCDTGSAKITDGYRLPAKKVIHAVGPLYLRETKENAELLLSGCYRTSLELAVENGLKSIAFSAVGTGMYCYPSDKASKVALKTVREFLEEGKGDEMDRIIFCNFTQEDEDAYFKDIPHFFPPVAEADKTEPTATSTDEAELAAKLPDAPAAEPKDPEEPSAKRQKTEDVEDDFVVVDKEDVKDAESVAPKADL